MLAVAAAFLELAPIVGPTISLLNTIIVTLVANLAKTLLGIALHLVVRALKNAGHPGLQGQALGCTRCR